MNWCDKHGAYTVHCGECDFEQVHGADILVADILTHLKVLHIDRVQLMTLEDYTSGDSKFGFVVPEFDIKQRDESTLISVCGYGPDMITAMQDLWRQITSDCQGDKFLLIRRFDKEGSMCYRRIVQWHEIAFKDFTDEFPHHSEVKDGTN